MIPARGRKEGRGDPFGTLLDQHQARTADAEGQEVRKGSAESAPRKSEVGGRRSEASRPEATRRRSEVRGQRSEVGGQRPEARGLRPEARCSASDDVQPAAAAPTA